MVFPFLYYSDSPHDALYFTTNALRSQYTVPVPPHIQLLSILFIQKWITPKNSRTV